MDLECWGGRGFGFRTLLAIVGQVLPTLFPGSGFQRLAWGFRAVSSLKTVVIRVLPPLSSSWKIFIIKIYQDLNSSPIIDCYCMGAVPRL